MVSAKRPRLSGPDPGPTAFVLFGATGDLAKRLVLPAFFRVPDRVGRSVLEEQQIYRIDHFLGKEATQDLHLLRFANGSFAAMWGREHIESVQIDVPEKLGITDRAGFYDATGAVLDMLVTHLFQAAAEIAMKRPASLGAADLQAAREKVIKSFRPLDPDEVVLGQFAGYRHVPE